MSPRKAAIDTSFFLGSLAEASEPEGRYAETCKNIIHAAGRGYEVIIPVIVPSEYLFRAISKAGEDKERLESLISYFKRWLIEGRFTIFNMEEGEVWEIFDKLDFLRGKHEKHDKMIVSCAIAAECKVIFTLDGDLYRERREIAKISYEFKGYRIDIGHPDDAEFRKKFLNG